MVYNVSIDIIFLGSKVDFNCFVFYLPAGSLLQRRKSMKQKIDLVWPNLSGVHMPFYKSGGDVI